MKHIERVINLPRRGDIVTCGVRYFCVHFVENGEVYGINFNTINEGKNALRIPMVNWRIILKRYGDKLKVRIT